MTLWLVEGCCMPQVQVDRAQEQGKCQVMTRGWGAVRHRAWSLFCGVNSRHRFGGVETRCCPNYVCRIIELFVFVQSQCRQIKQSVKN